MARLCMNTKKHLFLIFLTSIQSVNHKQTWELYTPSAIILPKTFSFINIVNWNTSFFNIPILAMLANSAIAQCARVFYEPCVRLLATICRPPPVPLSCIAENCKDFFCKWKAHAICCFGSLSICFGRFPCFDLNCSRHPLYYLIHTANKINQTMFLLALDSSYGGQCKYYIQS